jgi:ELWxxDGT repeat protein
VLVRDIWPGTSSSQPEGFTSVNGGVLFVASDDVAGKELWRTDGTAAGTLRVKDIRPDVAGSNPGGGSSDPFTVLDGQAYFSAYDDANGSRLWKSDRTEAGTQLVEADCPCAAGPGRPTNVNGMLLFGASGEGVGRELWRSDGTLGGTALVKDLAPGLSGGANGWLAFPTYFSDNATNRHRTRRSSSRSARPAIGSRASSGAATAPRRAPRS